MNVQKEKVSSGNNPTGQPKRRRTRRGKGKGVRKKPSPSTASTATSAKTASASQPFPKSKSFAPKKRQAVAPDAKTFSFPACVPSGKTYGERYRAFRKYVVHVRKADFDVYVGRHNPRLPFAQGPCVWGNPFKMHAEPERVQVCETYERWLWSQPELVAKARAQLKGKVLACWCAPKLCHAMALAGVANTTGTLSPPSSLPSVSRKDASSAQESTQVPLAAGKASTSGNSKGTSGKSDSSASSRILPTDGRDGKPLPFSKQSLKVHGLSQEPHSKCSTVMIQPFRYYCILDFEAVWDAHDERKAEIIEFPCVLLNAATLAIEDEFHTYVKPELQVIHEECTKLTGIKQSWVEDACHFKVAYVAVLQWLQKKNLNEQNTCFVTCGDWDLKKMLPKQLHRELKNTGSALPHPPILRSWVNIKRTLMEHYKRRRQTGMDGMLRFLNIPLTGRHHSGLDDCRNICKIVIHLLLQGCKLTPNFHGLLPVQ